ncbi:MAG: SRPBCC family protein [Chloroflexi bacterium]|nr:SRPBCC family protein [Chloroflexota bacterium]
MASNDYHFITTWRVTATLQEVNDILGSALDLPRWWPSVYIDVKELSPGDERGIGKVIDLYTKGFLPYTLRWQVRVTESRAPHGFTLEAWGDFVGRGSWTFEPDGDEVLITYDWAIRADKPLLRNLSFLMKPFFSANHRWAMQKGLESLQIELARRHASTPEEHAMIPAPPARTTTSPVPLALGALTTFAGALLLARQLGRARG